MSGYVDLHSHLLPGFDDGAKEAAETLAILAHAQAAGFAVVFATPHWMSGAYEPTRDAVDGAIAALAPALARERPGLTLRPGAEHYLDDGFQQLMASGGLQALAGSDHVLVEAPLLHLPPQIKDYAFRLRVKGLVPVLAHPERNADVVRDPKLGRTLVDAGFRLQLNLGSFAGMYGRQVRKAATWLLERELADFLGSDAHTPAQAAEAFGEGLAELTELADQSTLRRLLIDNPRELLEGAPHG